MRRASPRFGRRTGYLTKVGGGAAFDPTTLAFSGYWRADYAGAPWSGTASAGLSTGRDLVTDGGNDPSTSASQNGFAGADFIAANSDRLKTALDMVDLVGATGWTCLCVLKPRNLAADGTVTQNQTIVSEVGQYFGLEVFDNGARVWQYNSAGTLLFQDATTGPASNSYCLVHAKWDGAKIYAGFNGTYSAGTALTTIAAATGGSRIGSYYNGSSFYLDGIILELAFATSVLSAGDISNYKSYVNSRYGLSL